MVSEGFSCTHSENITTYQNSQQLTENSLRPPLNSLELNRTHRNSVELTRTHKNSLRTHRISLRPCLNSSELNRTHGNSMRPNLISPELNETEQHGELIQTHKNSLVTHQNSQEINRNSHRTQNHPRYKIRPPALKDKRYRGWRGDFHSEPTSQGQHARTH